MKQSVKLLKVLTLILISVLAIVLVLIPPMQYYYFRQFIYKSVDSVPEREYILLVLGASVKENEYPSNALQERLDTAVTLFESGKVAEIVVSGSKDGETYDEPKVMKTALVKAGVPENLIVEDGEGDRTFSSCKNLSDRNITEPVIIISQGFHLPRALFLCRSLGVSAEGVYSVGSFSTFYSRWYTIREILAMYLAVWDVAITF